MHEKSSPNWPSLVKLSLPLEWAVLTGHQRSAVQQELLKLASMRRKGLRQRRKLEFHVNIRWWLQLMHRISEIILSGMKWSCRKTRLTERNQLTVAGAAWLACLLYICVNMTFFKIWFKIKFRKWKDNRVDVGAGPFSVTYSRAKVVDFTVSFYEEPTAILVPPPTEDTALLACTRPFQLQVKKKIPEYDKTRVEY